VAARAARRGRERRGASARAARALERAEPARAPVFDNGLQFWAPLSFADDGSALPLAWTDEPRRRLGVRVEAAMPIFLLFKFIKNSFFTTYYAKAIGPARILEQNEKTVLT